MSDEKLTPERAVRLLRAKGAELEHASQQKLAPESIPRLAADIALIAQLLADHIDHHYPAPIRTKTGKILTDDDIQALADEAEAGYDVSHLKRDECTCTSTDWGCPVHDPPRTNKPEVW